MARTTWRGVRLDTRNIASLEMAEKVSGVYIAPSQGGYSTSVSASAGTHAGSGSVDVIVRGWSTANINKLLKALRECGWAAWLRTPAQGFVLHIHAVMIGDPGLSSGAAHQVSEYKSGRNGLKGRGKDDGPDVGYTTWTNSRHNPANKASTSKPTPKPKAAKAKPAKAKSTKPKPVTYRVTASALYGLDRAGGVNSRRKHLRKRGFKVVAHRHVKSADGRTWAVTRYNTFYDARYLKRV